MFTLCNFSISEGSIDGFAPGLLATIAPTALAKSIAFSGFLLDNNWAMRLAKKESPAPTVSETFTGYPYGDIPCLPKA